MERFQHIVRFGVHGHAHVEMFNISNSMTNPDKPLVYHMVGGSVTPIGGNHNGKNPQLKTFDIDVETLLPLDISSYYYDIEKANADGEPTWLLGHSYRDTF